MATEFLRFRVTDKTEMPTITLQGFPEGFIIDYRIRQAGRLEFLEETVPCFDFVLLQVSVSMRC